MKRYFALYHGLTPSAPWGVACEHESGSPKVELLLLCRTEQDALQYATVTSLGVGLKSLRDEQVTAREQRGTRGN
jgi:hypothetical protein